MIRASCHCGAVSIEVDGAVDEVTLCNCSICRRLGALWTYHSPGKVTVRADPPTQTYVWGDRCLATHRCARCGCVTHWSPMDPALDRMGVNARLMDPAVAAGARVRQFDGAGM